MNNKKRLEIDKVKYFKELVILKFKEFDNINDVIKFKNSYLYISEEDKVQLPEGSYFIFDIVGCTVYNTEGQKIGTVTEVIQSASNDIYVVKDKIKNRSYLIPAVREFVIEVDIAAKKIIIDTIEGMIE